MFFVHRKRFKSSVINSPPHSISCRGAKCRIPQINLNVLQYRFVLERHVIKGQFVTKVKPPLLILLSPGNIAYTHNNAAQRKECFCILPNSNYG